MKNKITALLLLLFFAISFESCKDDNEDNTTLPTSILGDASKAYLSGAVPSLDIQIDYVTGFQPTNQTIDNLKNFLTSRLNKPGGISVSLREIPSPQNSKYTIDQIRAIESQSRTVSSTTSKMSAYIVFLDNDYIESQGNQVVLGVAYSSTSFAIFEKTIKGLSGGLGEPSETTLESAVTQHEFGHLLGLVNTGTPITSNHHDEANGAHCTNSDCLMHFSIQTGTSLGNMLGGNVPELDADCIRDLQANGGK
tara:strand:+ start:157 stop:912 length:756 start_codon:yes stop_codon:yes gene_type:complete